MGGVDPPGPPSAPTASDVTRESCTLSWRAPDSDGGAEIVGYHVERCLGKSNRWIRITKDPVPELTFAVKELIEDNVYEFRVYAVNKVGDGPVGPSSEPVTAKDPWGMSLTSGDWIISGFVIQDDFKNLSSSTPKSFSIESLAYLTS